MNILITDDVYSSDLLKIELDKWGDSAHIIRNAYLAWQTLSEQTPELVIIDWLMPGLERVELCQKIRNSPRLCSTYIILLTAFDDGNDVTEGLQAGADDFITKPFHADELYARIRVGMRIAKLQTELRQKIAKMESTMLKLQQLHKLLSICSYCKRIRDDNNYWQQFEIYISQRSETQFSHGICPHCYDHIVKPELEKLRIENDSSCLHINPETP